MIRERGWERFVGFRDVASATAAAGYLAQHDLPTRVEAGSPGVDMSLVAYVLVPGELLHRARWLWAQAELTESELHFLAAGELSGSDQN